MKNLKNVRYALFAAFFCTLALIGISADSHAQTQPMTIDVQVTNTLTLTTDSEMNFGEIAAISNAAQTASIPLSTAGALGAPTSTGAPAYIAVIDNTAASETQITVTDGAPGATLNLTINNVVPPVNGGVSFQIGAWQSSWNAGAATPRAVGVAWQQTYLDNAGAGSVLQLGATLTTNAAGTPYTDGVYAGTFDMVFSY